MCRNIWLFRSDSQTVTVHTSITMNRIFTHRTKQLLNSPNTSTLIFLNWEFPRAALELIWNRVGIHICADGAANRLAKDPHQTVTLLPDYIHGDLDSIHSDVKTSMESNGVHVSQNKGQDSTDLDKCLELVQKVADSNLNLHSNSKSDTNSKTNSQHDNQTEKHIRTDSNVLVLGAFGGRLDHEMANLNSAVRWSKSNKAGPIVSPLTLLSEHSIAYVLAPGTHNIYPDLSLEGPTCGLIPLGETCESITTTGLKWNLNQSKLEFGGLVSTSNAMKEGVEKITVETSHHVLWTTHINWQRYEKCLHTKEKLVLSSL